VEMVSTLGVSSRSRRRGEGIVLREVRFKGYLLVKGVFRQQKKHLPRVRRSLYAFLTGKTSATPFFFLTGLCKA